MPELPEVEGARFVVEKFCLNHTVTSVNLREQGGGPRNGLFDDLVFSPTDGGENVFKTAMLHRTLVGFKRHGKQMWLQLAKNVNKRTGGSKVNILMHLGMTGSLRLKGEAVPQYRVLKDKDSAWPPRFCKCEIVFDSGVRLAFCDPRRLGRIRIRGDDVCDVPPLGKLAPDPILHGVDPDRFEAVMHKHKIPIKALLLDQEKAVAGIGNWMADEVLYQTGIHPETPCCSLPAQKTTELAKKIEEVSGTGCECTVANRGYPEHWLFNYRWQKANSKANHITDYYGHGITFVDVGGRTSAVVSAVQKKSGWGQQRQQLGGSAGSSNKVAQPKPKSNKAAPLSAVEDSASAEVKVSSTSRKTASRKTHAKKTAVAEDKEQFKATVPTSNSRGKRKTQLTSDTSSGSAATKRSRRSPK